MKLRTISFLVIGLLGGCLAPLQSGRAASRFDQNLDRTFEVQPGGRLVIHADRGSIKITTDGVGRVHVRVLRQVQAADQAEADALFATHEVDFEQGEQTVTVTALSRNSPRFSTGRQPSLDVRYEVSIPKRFDVDLKTAGGDVHVGDLDGRASARTTSGSIHFGAVSGPIEAADAGGNIHLGPAGSSVRAQTTSGSITLEQANGQVTLTDAGGNILVKAAGSDVIAKTSSGSISLGRVNGGVTAANAGGDIQIDSAGEGVEAQTTSGSISVGAVNAGKTRLTNAGGNIEVDSAAGDVFAKTTSGKIQVKSVQGKLEARNAGGDIKIGRARGVLAATTSGTISIEHASGSVEADDAGGNIRIGTVAGDAQVRTTSGTIIVTRASGKLEAHNAGGDIQVQNARGTIAAETTSGSIQVVFSAPPNGECRLIAEGGGIHLALPRMAAVNLQAHANGGNVQCDLPVTSTGSGPIRPGVLEGKINGGGPALVLRASSGNIHVSASPSAPLAVEEEPER